MARICVLFLFGLLCAGRGGAAEGEDRLVPMSPKELLKMLPVAREGWEITTSRGRSLYLRGLTTRATREYRWTGKGKDGKEIVMNTRIVLRDTAGDAASLALFHRAEERPNLPDANVLSLRVEEYPALAVRRGKESEEWELRILVGERFVIEVAMEGQEEDDAGKWLGWCNLAALKSAPKERLAKASKVVNIVWVDELEPARNRAYRMSVNPGGEEDAEAKGGK